MDPNNNTPNQVPEPAPVTETPVQPAQPVVVTPMEPIAPAPVVEPIADNPVPAQPVMQPAVSEPAVAEQQPQPVVPAAPVVAKKSSAKLFIIIGAVVLLLAGVGVALWMFVFSGMPLKEYKSANGGYSVMVPASYEEEVMLDSNSSSVPGSSVLFNKPETTESVDRSSIKIGAFAELPTDGSSLARRSSAVDSLNMYIDLTIKASNEDTSPDRESNLDLKKYSKNGLDFWDISGNIIKDNQITAKLRRIVIMGDSKMYAMEIIANNSDDDLLASTNKIIDSFTVK